MSTRCTCGRGCKTFGECMRRKGIRVGWCKSLVGLDRTDEKAKNTELALYASARKQGIQPAMTKTPQIRYALDQSDKQGRAWNAGNPLAGVEL